MDRWYRAGDSQSFAIRLLIEPKCKCDRNHDRDKCENVNGLNIQLQFLILRGQIDDPVQCSKTNRRHEYEIWVVNRYGTGNQKPNCSKRPKIIPTDHYI